MKITSFLIILFLSLISCNQKQLEVTVNDNTSIRLSDSADVNNNFYDNSETYSLPVKDLVIEGEIENPGKVDFSALRKHSVIVKEALLDNNGSDKFTGAFRYDGYSLFDILENRIVKKANADEFNSVIDLFVEIENEEGEKVVFSWGEIFYPSDLHKILIASDVARIIPSKTGELWDLPVKSRIIASADLVTERNISDPVKITVRSFPKSFRTVKGLSPMYSAKISLYNGQDKAGEISDVPEAVSSVTYNTVFYGRGRGIHSTSPFTGIRMKDVLSGYYPVSADLIKKGIFCIAAVDGYRCAISYSELFNRNDQQEFLIIRGKTGEDGGLFRMFATPDFFSDRAIKSVSEIDLGF